MQMQKSVTALSAALAMIALSTSASAFECGEPLDMADAMEQFAFDLRCDDSPEPNLGAWPAGNPLWERRMGPSCDDHTSTAGAFYEVSEPKGKNPQGKPAKETGIVVALRQYNYEEALRDLYAVRTDVSGDDVNTQFDPDFATAKLIVMDIKNEISEMIVCVEQLIED
jgi:hypothetical protein